jgi:hypothetical protein
VPVIINEIEVLEPPSPQAPAAGSGPAAAAPPVSADRILRLLRDAAERQRRLVAD